MFADSPIAKGFHPSVDNIRCMTNYGIAPYYKGLLIDSLKKSDCFVVSFDESLNNFVKSCGRVLLLRYSDSDDFTVKFCYYDSRFFNHTNHQDLVKQFSDVMKQLDVNKLLQVFMDGPSVNQISRRNFKREKSRRTASTY